MFDPLSIILLRMDYIPGPPIELNETSLIALGVVAAACLAVSVVGVMLLIFSGKEAGAAGGAVAAVPVNAAPAAALAAPKGATGAPRPEAAGAGRGAAPSARTPRPGAGAPKPPRGEGGRPK